MKHHEQAGIEGAVAAEGRKGGRGGGRGAARGGRANQSSRSSRDNSSRDERSDGHLRTCHSSCLTSFAVYSS